MLLLLLVIFTGSFSRSHWVSDQRRGKLLDCCCWSEWKSPTVAATVDIRWINSIWMQILWPCGNVLFTRQILHCRQLPLRTAAPHFLCENYEVIKGNWYPTTQERGGSDGDPTNHRYTRNIPSNIYYQHAPPTPPPLLLLLQEKEQRSLIDCCGYNFKCPNYDNIPQRCRCR